MVRHVFLWIISEMIVFKRKSKEKWAGWKKKKTHHHFPSLTEISIRAGRLSYFFCATADEWGRPFTRDTDSNDQRGSCALREKERSVQLVFVSNLRAGNTRGQWAKREREKNMIKNFTLNKSPVDCEQWTGCASVTQRFSLFLLWRLNIRRKQTADTVPRTT